MRWAPSSNPMKKGMQKWRSPWKKCSPTFMAKIFPKIVPRVLNHLAHFSLTSNPSLQDLSQNSSPSPSHLEVPFGPNRRETLNLPINRVGAKLNHNNNNSHSRNQITGHSHRVKVTAKVPVKAVPNALVRAPAKGKAAGLS